MGKHGDHARESLLNAAEELFARYGIDAVSNRRIAEHAGTANHSAVAYHFGGREQLLEQLITRYVDAVLARRQELTSQLGASPSVHDLVRCRLIPFVEMLDALPRPSWRARFLAQVRSVPSAVDVVKRSLLETGVADEFAVIREELAHVPRGVLRARSGVLSHMVIGICAEHEAQLDAGVAAGSWRSVGYFLVDAGAGMLTAPVTDRATSVLPGTPDLF